MNRETLKKELQKIGIQLTENQEKQLEKYYELLIQTNNYTNLTRITEKEAVYLNPYSLHDIYLFLI